MKGGQARRIFVRLFFIFRRFCHSFDISIAKFSMQSVKFTLANWFIQRQVYGRYHHIGHGMTLVCLNPDNPEMSIFANNIAIFYPHLLLTASNT